MRQRAGNQEPRMIRQDPTKRSWIAVGALCAVACAAKVPAVPQPAEDAPESAGIDLAIGAVNQGGRPQVTCSVTQETDVKLQISAVADCTTERPLSVSIKAAGLVLDRPMDIELEERVRKLFETFPFPPPPQGALIRTRLSGRCLNSPARDVWATAHCVMP
jgi:hypothetical protein